MKILVVSLLCPSFLFTGLHEAGLSMRMSSPRNPFYPHYEHSNQSHIALGSQTEQESLDLVDRHPIFLKKLPSSPLAIKLRDVLSVGRWTQGKEHGKSTYGSYWGRQGVSLPVSELMTAFSS